MYIEPHCASIPSDIYIFQLSCVSAHERPRTFMFIMMLCKSHIHITPLKPQTSFNDRHILIHHSSLSEEKKHKPYIHLTPPQHPILLPSPTRRQPVQARHQQRLAALIILDPLGRHIRAVERDARDGVLHAQDGDVG